MSLYDDIYNDFPLRCDEVWQKFSQAAKDERRDVTLMLMCAAGGFATPWEHFKIPEGAGNDQSHHPAFHKYDKQKYKRSLDEMNRALDGEISNSALFKDVQIDRCYYAHAKTIGEVKGLAESGENNAPPLSTQKTRQIVKALRNAIAHSNIFAFSGNKSQEISHLGFFSEEIDRKIKDKKVVDYYNVVVMSAEDFHAFLTAWFGLLKKANPKGNLLKLIITNALEADHEPIAAYG